LVGGRRVLTHRAWRFPANPETRTFTGNTLEEAHSFRQNLKIHFLPETT
jgi:hypothetical protein